MLKHLLIAATLGLAACADVAEYPRYTLVPTSQSMGGAKAACNALRNDILDGATTSSVRVNGFISRQAGYRYDSCLIRSGFQMIPVAPLSQQPMVGPGGVLIQPGEPGWVPPSRDYSMEAILRGRAERLGPDGLLRENKTDKTITSRAP